MEIFYLRFCQRDDDPPILFTYSLNTEILWIADKNCSRPIICYVFFSCQAVYAMENTQIYKGSVGNNAGLIKEYFLCLEFFLSGLM